MEKEVKALLVRKRACLYYTYTCLIARTTVKLRLNKHARSVLYFTCTVCATISYSYSQCCLLHE